MITGNIPQPKIILEGTHLTKKTDVAFALAEHVDIVGHRKRRWHIPLISSEWETLSDEQPTKANPGRSMIDFQDGDEPWVFECFDTYTRLLELNRDYYWIIDRFHISTIAHQRLNHGKRLDLSWVDDRLAAIGCVLIHLSRSPDTFSEARRERLRYSENPHRYDDIDLFLREQDLMADLIHSSAIRSTTVDVSDGDVPRIAQQILDWCKIEGLFYRPEKASGALMELADRERHNTSGPLSLQG
jgi:hypothetical protein